MTFVVIRDLDGRWRWELRNGEQTLARSAGTFPSEHLALVAIKEFRAGAPRSPLVEPDAEK